MADDLKTDGGPALPGYHWNLTLHDYFAGQALAGLVFKQHVRDGAEGTAPEDAALLAYQYADAMLKARKG